MSHGNIESIEIHHYSDIIYQHELQGKYKFMRGVGGIYPRSFVSNIAEHRVNLLEQLQIAPEYLKQIKRDPSGRGFTHLGKDGVLRTISGDNEVLDARGLDPEQIKSFLAWMPDELLKKEEFDHVDGTKVTSHEALFHPAPGILPKKPEEHTSR